jgi:hypothetical protein
VVAKYGIRGYAQTVYPMGFERLDLDHIVLHVRIRRGQGEGTYRIDEEKADTGQGKILEVMIE